MSAEISWIVELAVNPGLLTAFQALTEEMIESARNERGVLSFPRYISEDRKCVEVYERYADSAAATAHLRNFLATFAARFSTLVEPKRLTVFCRPSRELKALLDTFAGIAVIRSMQLCAIMQATDCDDGFAERPLVQLQNRGNWQQCE
jgi:quinol monooxygenase YgiN